MYTKTIFKRKNWETAYISFTWHTGKPGTRALVGHPSGTLKKPENWNPGP